MVVTLSCAQVCAAAYSLCAHRGFYELCFDQAGFGCMRCGNAFQASRVS